MRHLFLFMLLMGGFALGGNVSSCGKSTSENKKGTEPKNKPVKKTVAQQPPHTQHLQPGGEAASKLSS